jgi:nucleoside-diphosphate-sugar epimerase
MTTNTLVIGGSGYIGSALCPQLNTYYTNMDLHWFGGPSPNLKMDFGDITQGFLKNYDTIVLLAGHSSVAMCDHNLLGSWKNNVTNFINLLECMGDDQVLIYASSGSVYGSNNDTLCYESMDLPLESKTYDFTKKAIEKIAMKSDRNTVGLRFGTLNGWAPNTRTDLMINQMVLTAKTSNDIALTSVENYRSILGINDCVNAINAIIENPKQGNYIYNLSSLSGNVRSFGTAVKNSLNCNLTIHDEETSRFSFQLDNSRFIEDYNFVYLDTLQSLIEDLALNRYSHSHRRDAIDY